MTSRITGSGKLQSWGDMSASDSRWPGIFLLVFLTLLAVLAVVLQQPPPPAPAHAPPERFSAVRAFEHVQVIAQEPHPTGSPANAAVRDYLLAELSALGLSPRVHEAVVQGTRIQNVLARLEGSQPGGQALMLAAHYDSVASGPGAADDAAAVAALLETARALRAGPPLARDIIFLFPDGEEMGLLGARAFVQGHAWAADVRVVLNFEARGNRGPVYMFETSPQNGRLIQALARAAPHPVATSLMFAVYELLPNDTDFTVFARAGLQGLNFAFLGGATYYHSPHDTPENLSLRSLQHQGFYALPLARYFGHRDLDRPPEPSRVYFDLFGRALVHYPQAWVWPLTILAGLAYLAVTILGKRRRHVSLRGLAWGALAFLLTVLVAAGATVLLWLAVVQLHPGYAGRDFLDNGVWYWLASLALTTALVAVLYEHLFKPLLARWRHIPRERQVPSLALGALLWWLALLVASSLFVPGASYLFLWPMLATLAWLAGSFRRAARSAWLRAASLALAAIPALTLFMPLLYGLHQALPIRLLAVSAVLLTVMLGGLVPQLDLITRRARWLVPSLGLLATLVFLVAGSLTAAA